MIKNNIVSNNKSPSFFPIFSHKLTSQQKHDIRNNLNCKHIITLPPNLQTLWFQVPPEADNIDPIIQPIIDYLENKSQPGDYLLIQGDFGMTYKLVNWAKANAIIPVYSTTKRETQEVQDEDGNVKMIHNFKHVRFREY